MFAPNLPGCRPFLINYMAKVSIIFIVAKYFHKILKKLLIHSLLKQVDADVPLLFGGGKFLYEIS